ncbi:MAG: hypothetical protein GY778_12470, partial [bacterium]|nr:hypothetical protein [bacterium]
MKRLQVWVPILITTLLVLAPGQVAHAQAQEAAPESCSDCHNGKADNPRYTPPHETLGQSSHAALDCTDCHESISMHDLDRQPPSPPRAGPHPLDRGRRHQP